MGCVVFSMSTLWDSGYFECPLTGVRLKFKCPFYGEYFINRLVLNGLKRSMNFCNRMVLNGLKRLTLKRS